jgi:hypothetical protein
VTSSIERGNLDLFVRHAKINNYLVGKALPIIIGAARTNGIKASLDGTVWGVCSHETSVTNVNDNGINLAFEQTTLSDDDGAYTVIEVRTGLRNSPIIASHSNKTGYTGSLYDAIQLLGSNDYQQLLDLNIAHVISKPDISVHAALNALLSDAGFTRNPIAVRNFYQLTEPKYKTFDYETYISSHLPVHSVRLQYHWDYAENVFRNIDVMAIAGAMDQPLDLPIKSVVSASHARLYGELFLNKHANGIFKCEADQVYQLGETFTIPKPNVAPGTHATVIAVDNIARQSTLEIWTPADCKANLISATAHSERLSTDRKVNESVTFSNGLVTYEILDENGEGIIDAIVTLVDAENRRQTYVTNASGSFIFQAQTGDQFSVSVELGGDVINAFQIVI